MLTPRQASLLAYIDAKIREDGFAPSLAEMAAAHGGSTKSKGSVHEMLGRLEERGFIRRIRNRARAIEVLRGPMGDKSNV